MEKLSNNHKNYIDYSIFGEVDHSGNILVYTGIDAIANSIRGWLASVKWGHMRNPNYGGKIVPYLMKIMSDDNAQQMEYEIKNGIEREFKPKTKVLSCSVNPNYKKERYEINIKIYVPSLDQTTDVNVGLNQVLK